MQKRKRVSVSKNVTAKNNNRTFKTEIGLKQSLVKSSNAIRKKFQDLHNDKQIVNEHISETYKPIIDPIKKLVDDNKKKIPEKTDPTPIKSELKNESDSIYRTAYLPPHRRKLFATTAKKLSFEPHNISEIDDIENNNNAEDNSMKQIREQAKQISSADKDNIYGIRLHHGDLFMGKEPIKFTKDNDELKYLIGNKKFTVTNGLTDLLIGSNPQFYSNQDLETYKDMLTYTSAHKKNYNPSGAIRRSKSSKKYNKIITQLFPERRSSRLNVGGEGVKWQHRQQMKKLPTVYKTFNRTAAYDYKYWDDPNELVDRLRLLVSSQTAGHTGHNNEIIAIIEELQEAKIIV